MEIRNLCCKSLKLILLPRILRKFSSILIRNGERKHFYDSSSTKKFFQNRNGLFRQQKSSFCVVSFSKLSSNAVLKNTMRPPNVNLSMDELRRNVDYMLANFREKELHRKKSDVIHATFLCNLTGRYGEFVDVVDEWFRQAKMLLDDRSFFKASSDLCNLGKLNRVTNGRLVRQLGWEPIEYFLRRMLEMGLHRFHAEDIVSALIGVHDLIVFSDYCHPSQSSIDQKSIPVFAIFDAWLTEFELYLTEKHSSDSDWSILVRDVAPLSLWYLKEIDAQSIIADHRSLLERLYRLSKSGFDEISKEKRGNDVDENWKSIYTAASIMYAQACLCFDIDPESIEPNSWRSWMDVYILSVKSSEKICFLDFSISLQLASKFTSFRSTVFWTRFDVWYAELEKSIRLFLNEKIDSEQNSRAHSEKKAVVLIFALGNLAKACRGGEDKEFVVNADRFRLLTSMLDDLFSSISIFDKLSIVQISKILSGFRELKRSLESNSHQLSDKFFNRLFDWCQSIRQDSTQRRNLANGMSAIADLLTTQRPPTFILNEISILFYNGLEDLDSDDLPLTLALFGFACVTLRFDAARVRSENRNRSDRSDIDYRLDDFWKLYFRKADFFMRNQWPLEKNDRKSEGLRSNCEYLLRTLPTVALKMRQLDEFEKSIDIYERRLKQVNCKIRRGITVYDALSEIMLVDKRLKFDLKLMDDLKRNN